MILFLYGPDTFSSKRKLNEIIKKYRLKYKSGINFAKIESTEDGFEELKIKSGTISMFKEKKLIVLEGALSAPKSFQDKIKKYLTETKQIFEDKNIILIIFEDEKIKKTNSLFKLLLKKSFKKQEFKELPPLKIKEFIKKETESLGGKIDSPAIAKLIFYYKNDLWQIEEELKKLIAFKFKEEIQEKDIKNLCEAKISPNIFNTIEAISRGNKEMALRMISEHIETGENEIKILTMINFQFRNLIKIKSLAEQGKDLFQIQKLSKIHPFVIRKALPIARSFSMEKLKNIYQKLFLLDFKIKTGKIESRLGIEMFILGL